MTIGIIDYAMGIIGSVCGALEYLKVPYIVLSLPEELAQADAYILPGVGAFGVAIEYLAARGLLPFFFKSEVRGRGKYLLGICLGLQLLAKDSTEGGFQQGLGWVGGHVVSLEPFPNMPVPHVGWSAVRIEREDPLRTGLPEDAPCYFDHSYHLVCEPK